MYQRLKIKKLITVPIKPRPTGFLVVRNPQQYITCSSMLQMSALLNEQKLMQSMKLAISPENIKRNTDVIINLFGNLEINTANGILRESALKSPKICRLLAYIVLNRKPSVPARKVVRQFGQRKRLNQTILGKICGP